MLRIIFLLIITSSLFISCNRKNEMENFNWIAGKWENISDSSRFYENWEKMNDSVFAGEAFVIESGETVFSEKISIEKKGSDIFYFANVADQNNGQPIPFKLISSSLNEVIFENKDHDFPNKITYSQISGDSMMVKIEGLRMRKSHTEYFPFTRRGTDNRQ